MVVIIGDGVNTPISINIRVLALYDDHGVPLFGAEQLNEKHIQMGTLDDADLQDIVRRNGFPFRPLEDVSSNFPIVNKGRVLSIKQ